MFKSSPQTRGIAREGLDTTHGDGNFHGVGGRRWRRQRLGFTAGKQEAEEERERCEGERERREARTGMAGV